LAANDPINCLLATEINEAFLPSQKFSLRIAGNAKSEFYPIPSLRKMKLRATAASSAIIALTLVSRGADVQAFAPVGLVSAAQVEPRSSFMASPNKAEARRGSPTSLAMKGNLVDRFVRVFNANLNKIVSGLEDPEKVIVQAVDDMQVSYV
jgi:hypothetical protein